jgi:outer membrane protein assembly factor BamA
MRSRSRAAHISETAVVFALLLLHGASAACALSADTVLTSGGTPGPFVGSVRYEGLERLDRRALAAGSLLRSGSVLSDRLISRELARLDSLLTSEGLLGAEVRIDSLMSGGTADLLLTITEGEQARVGSAVVTGSDVIEAGQLLERLGLRPGAPFDPRALRRSMTALLADLNDSGYPYAQVWITGFDWRGEAGEVDISVAAYGGEAATVGAVTFEGLSATDTTLALRVSRLRPGRPYDERRISRAARFLKASGYFSEVGEPRVIRLGPGSVDVRIPVTEHERRNRFEGMFGFSRKADGGYRTSGSVDLGLENIGGTGRSVAFRWLGDGEQYRTTLFRYGEPFLFTLPVSLEAELRQDVYDTLYDFTLAGLDLLTAAGPVLSLSAGFTWDQTVPKDDPALDRSVRNRLRAGVAVRGVVAGASLRLEGARKKSYRPGGKDETWSQLLYRFEADLTAPTFPSQAFFVRVSAEGVLSRNEISLSETYPLGGARTLRGYRENQFRGEQIAFANLEYRFGGDSRLFLFDDIGAYYQPAANWTIKNGLGFGLRSSSKLGTVEMSFGVGEHLALEETRIHISLIESF